MTLPGADLYLRLGYTELANRARFAAYANNGFLAPGMNLRVEDTCALLAPWVEDNYPGTRDPSVAFTGYTTPDDANFPAPWYDPAVTHSEDFAGLLVQSVEMSSPYQRSPTRRTNGGSALGQLFPEGRTVTVVGWLFGRTCCSVAYGLRWLTASIADGVQQVAGTGTETAFYRRCPSCNRGDLIMLQCCPDEVDQCGPDPALSWPAVATFERRLVKVGVIAGPEVLARRGNNCGCGGCSAMQVQFQLHAEDGHFYLPSTLIGDPDEWTSPAATVVGVTTYSNVSDDAFQMSVPVGVVNDDGDGVLVVIAIPGNRTVLNVAGANNLFDLVFTGAITSGGASTDIRVEMWVSPFNSFLQSTYDVTLSAACPVTATLVGLSDVSDAVAGYVSGDAGDLIAPAVPADLSGPTIYVGAIRSSASGPVSYTPPGGYTELSDVSLGSGAQSCDHEVAVLSHGAFTTIPATGATTAFGGGTRVGVHIVLQPSGNCAVDWEAADECECVDDTPQLITPACLPAAPPLAPTVAGPDCFCDFYAKIRGCISIDPGQTFRWGDAVLRVQVTAAAEGSGVVYSSVAIKGYDLSGVSPWTAVSPEDCPGEDICPDWTLIVPQLPNDSVLTIDGMRGYASLNYQPFIPFVGPDGPRVTQVDQWVGTPDGRPAALPVICGPVCICFEIDFTTVVDPATGLFLDAPSVLVDLIPREL